MTFAHLAGVPLEETILALAPLTGVLAVYIAASLRRLGRHDPHPTRKGR